MPQPAHNRPLRVAWISDFPIEWLPGVPEEISRLPKQHPATWEWVLRDELEHDPEIELHICILRKQVERDITFTLRRTTFHVCKVPGGLRAPSLFWIDTHVLRRVLRKIKPDLVHAWGTERGAALVASRLKYPYLVTIQGLLSWYRALVPLTKYERFAALLEKWSVRRAKVVTTESCFAVDYLKSRYPGTIIHQAEHAPNRIFHNVQRAPQTQPVRIVSVGTPGYRKGSDLLLRGLGALLDEVPFELLVVGSMDESFLAPLRAQVPSSLWERIEFRSNLQPAQIANELATATLIALPTRADTSPNAVKEAVVAGVPVVASNVGGIPDYVFPGQNGVLFEAGNLQSLVRAFREAVGHPLFGQGLVEPDTLRQNREYLSPERMHRLFVSAYRSTLESFHKPGTASEL